MAIVGGDYEVGVHVDFEACAEGGVEDIVGGVAEEEWSLVVGDM